MKIRLEDAIPFPAKDVLYLNDQLIRFQLECPRQPSPYDRFVVGQYSSVDEIFPEAPNRKAVRDNLATLEKTLDAALSLMRGRPFGADCGIMSRQDVLSFNLDHFYRPTCLYTNAQAIVSVVERNSERLEVVHHPSLRNFNVFDSLFTGLISAKHVVMAKRYEEAERVAQERLSTVETWTLRLRNGAELDELVLQPAGSIAVERGYSLTTLVATFRGDGFRLQMGGGPCSAHEPYRVLNELRPNGFIVEACATCLYFRFTGLTRDWSAGSGGYCTCPSQKNTTARPPTVSVRHYCPEYTFVEDGQRQYPYIRPV